MSTQEVIFIAFSVGMLIALIVAIWKLGNSVPAWVIDVLQAGGSVGREYAKATENKLDDEAWDEFLRVLEAEEKRRAEQPPVDPPAPPEAVP